MLCAVIALFSDDGDKEASTLRVCAIALHTAMWLAARSLSAAVIIETAGVRKCVFDEGTRAACHVVSHATLTSEIDTRLPSGCLWESASLE